MLRDSDDDAGFYCAACGTGSGWRGASLYRSDDGGANYSLLDSFRNPATTGVCTSILGTFTGGNIPDELNSLTVSLYYGELASITFANFVNGTQTAVIGNEIVSFREATLIAPSTYKLRGFLRGLRGSEYAISTHAASERFLLLNTATVLRISDETGSIGVSKQYKAVTFGSTSMTGTVASFTNAGTGLKPYCVVHVGGGRFADGALQINWIRRARTNGAWRDSVDVSLGEASEAYEVEIWNDTRTALLRTFAGLTVPTLTYSAAQQVADFGSVHAAVRVSIFQMSATVGRGFEARATL